MTGAHGAQVAAEQLLARGVHAVLPKPFDLVGLVAMVARFATPN
jgi:CheY-like chemotaxis protein